MHSSEFVLHLLLLDKKSWWSSCITVAEKSIEKETRGIRQKLKVHERNSGEVNDLLVDMITLASSNIKTLEVQQQQKS